MNGIALAAPLLVLLAPLAAVAAEEAVPLPRGWIGTTSDWLRGLGIVFVLVNLTLLAVAWRSLRRSGLTPTARGWLLVAVGLVPMMVAFLSFAHGLESSSTVASCGACHVMTPFVADLRNSQSVTLAATHFKNQYIQEKHCYTCHSDYGLTGTLGAKLAGLGHVWRSTVGSYTVPIKIARPYPNVRCLGCHGASLKFHNSPGHPKELVPTMVDNTMPCLTCHGPAHPAPKQAASR
ncbi:MAG TPA: NapC/NirT family cytochrome c [Methylomirabilota bacterium]|nr:NapC/NirT family cytochrome c [Methylomirabilota bacterium]